MQRSQHSAIPVGADYAETRRVFTKAAGNIRGILCYIKLGNMARTHRRKNTNPHCVLTIGIAQNDISHDGSALSTFHENGCCALAEIAVIKVQLALAVHYGLDGND